MKSRKVKLPFFNPRLMAFLLFLSMLLSTVAVFPSSVYAVESEGEPLTEGQEPLPEEPLTLPDQSITTEETEFEHFDENSIAPASVTSTPVVNNTANTTIVPSQNKVDLSVGNKLIIRIQTTLSNVQSVTVSIDNTAIMTYETISAYQNGQMYIRVTAANIGIAKITATVRRSSGTNETVSLEMYVVMDDGIYTIESCASGSISPAGNYYLRTGNLSSAFAGVRAATKTYGGLAGNIHRYWKTEYLGYGEYRIYPTAHEAKILRVVTGSVTVSERTNDAYEKWEIRYQSGGHMIVNEWTGLCIILSGNTASSVTEGDNSYYFIGAAMTSVNNTASKFWKFTALPETSYGVCFREEETQSIYNTVTVETGLGEGQVTLSDLGYSVIHLGCDDGVGWETSNWEVASVDINNGIITPTAPGTVIITANCYVCNCVGAVTLKVTWDGTYYLRNLQNNLYADIYNGTMANNNLVEQQTFDGANTQRWVVTHVGNDTYTIQSSQTSQNTSYYLGVAGNSTTNGANVVLRTGTVTNGMKWRIVAGEEGYKIVSCLSSARVLKATDSTAASYLVSGAYTADSDYKDEWLLSLPSSAPKWEEQQTDHWCWVASAKIASYRYQDSPITQACAAVYAKLDTITMNPTTEQVYDTWHKIENGLVEKTGGNKSQTAKALYYITGVHCLYTEQTISKTALQNLLDDGSPVIITRGEYITVSGDEASNVGNKEYTGHATVIVSYRVNSENGEIEFEIYDPWTEDNKTYYWSYEAICDGSVIYYDSKIWNGIIIFEHEDYINTENWNSTREE